MVRAMVYTQPGVCHEVAFPDVGDKYTHCPRCGDIMWGPIKQRLIKCSRCQLVLDSWWELSPVVVWQECKHLSTTDLYERIVEKAIEMGARG